MFWELQFTLNFIRDFLTQNNLLTLYQQLITHYQQVQTEYTAELEQNIQTTRTEIDNIHNQVNYSAWSAPKLSIIKQIAASNLIGSTVVVRLNEIFSKSFGNPTTIVQQLEALRTETTQLQTKVEQLIQNLNLTEPIYTPEPEHQLLEISFEGNATLKNFWDLKDRSNEWIYVIRTFTRLTDAPFESAKIISIDSASPIGLDIESFKKTAEAIIAGTRAAIELKKLKDIFFTKKKDAEAIGLEKDTMKVVLKDIDQQYGNGYRKRIGELSVEITKTHRVKKPGANDEHEIENMVGIALEKMTALIRDGVRVTDPAEIQPQATPTESSLGVLYKEVKQIEDKITPLLEQENKKRLEEREQEMLKEIKGEDTSVDSKKAKPNKKAETEQSNNKEVREEKEVKADKLQEGK